mmetsp:Transcript_15561/g.24142  ORF Transcript_15561/g.24142 Transcript_15561/m.24142 type:complete len:301 (+) Transcript_15561:195-1097(+)
MFRKSYNPFARLDLPFRMPKEASPRVRRNRKSLAQHLEEQDRKLQQLPFEELPFGLQHQSKDEEDFETNNNSLNSCPPTICAPQDDCDLLELDYPDSPMTHPPRTVIVRTGGLKPRKKNSVHRKRLFSIDFSTICTERGEETSLDEEEDLSEEEVQSRSAASFHHHDDQDDEDDDGDNEWDEVATFSTYPPTSIMLVHNHLDVIATPRRSWMYRSCSDLSGSCSSHGQNASPPQMPSLTPLKLEEPQLWVRNEYESSYKLDVDEETDEEDQIPHIMSCPDSMLEDSEDEDDVFDFLCTET